MNDELVELACALTRIPAISDAQGGNELATQRFMAERFAALGARVRTFEPAEVPAFFTHPLCSGPGREYRDRPTVIAEVGPPDAPALLLLAHADTVPVFEPDKWTIPTHEGAVRDGKIYGLGCSDDRWGLASMLMILKSLGPRLGSLNKRLILASTIDEESGVGNGTLLLHLAGVRAEAALYLDGYRMEIFIGCLGGSTVYLRPCGPLDSARLDADLRSLDAMARQMSNAREKLFDIPFYGDNAMRQTSVLAYRRNDARGPFLIVPFYTLPGESRDAFTAELHNELDAALGVSAKDYDRAIREPWFEPAAVPRDTPILRHMVAAARAVLGVEPRVTTISKQDSFILANHARIPTISFGPTRRVEGRGAFHQPDECLDIEDLRHAHDIVEHAVHAWLAS